MKRFYKAASVAQEADGWRVLLDTRPVRTQGGRAQIVPTRALAEAMAAEWEGQPAEIDPALFVFRDMADFAIDAIALDRAEALAATLPFAETDTLCYRAEPDTALYDHQIAVWDPILAAAEARYGVRFTRVCGIIHAPQSPATLAAMQAEIAAQDDFTLAALRNMSSLAASLVVALAALQPGADVDALWAAASLEEEWQANLWGREEEAEKRRRLRRVAFAAAREFARLSTGADI